MAILKDLIRDLKGIVIPQYLRDDETDFEPLKGSNGALNVNINGSLANIPVELKANTLAETSAVPVKTVGRKVIKTTVFSALAVTATTNQDQVIALPPATAYAVLIRSTLDQDVTISMRDTSIPGFSGNFVYGTYGTVYDNALSYLTPKGNPSFIHYLDSKKFSILASPLTSITLRAVCGVAPTNGSISVDIWALV